MLISKIYLESKEIEYHYLVKNYWFKIIVPATKREVINHGICKIKDNLKLFKELYIDPKITTIKRWTKKKKYNYWYWKKKIHSRHVNAKYNKRFNIHKKKQYNPKSIKIKKILVIS